MTVLTKLGGSSNFSDIPDKVSFKSAENPPPLPLNFYSPNKSNMFKNKQFQTICDYTPYEIIRAKSLCSNNYSLHRIAELENYVKPNFDLFIALINIFAYSASQVEINFENSTFSEWQCKFKACLIFIHKIIHVNIDCNESLRLCFPIPRNRQSQLI